MSIDKEHWQAVYQKKATEEVSWYRDHLEQSLAFIRESNLEISARIVDIGGGASTLVDDLIEAGYHNIAVIDLAESALDTARERLGSRADLVEWIVGDATAPLLPEASVDLWHDRAVFHFLTDPQARASYVAEVMRCVKPGGTLVVATFAPDGPETCSGLPVARYDTSGIHAVFSEAFDKIGEAAETHHTPGGRAQSFAYCVCRRRRRS